MSALNFMTAGGMALIGGDLQEPRQQRIQKLAKAFGKHVRQLALANGIPASALSVWRASFFFGGVDIQSVYFLFADAAGGTQLRFMDLSLYGRVGLDRFVADVRSQVGDPVFSFELPISILKQPESKDDESTNDAARQYIDGLLRAFTKEAEEHGEIDESLCFVIMSFSGNPILQDFYEKSIKPTVESLGYRCERIDEQEFNGSIRDRILQNIRQARFIIADVTEARPNCYYELGVAHSVGKEVIHLTNSTKDIHFDIKDFNFIVYSRQDELSRKLKQRIEATVGGSSG